MALLAPTIVSCGKIFLLALNVLGLILSIGIIAVSAILYRAGEVAAENMIMVLLNQLAVNYEISVGHLMRNISIGLLVVGIIILLTAGFGFLGTFFQKVPFMIVYVALVFKICGFEIFVLYMFFKLKDEIFYTIKTKMLELLTVYKGNSEDILTKAWNSLFLWLDCCGVNQQSAVDDFANTQWNSSSRANQKIPGYCCIGATSGTGSTYFGKACTINPMPNTAYVNKGCYKEISDYLESYCNGFIATPFILLFLEAMAIGFAVLIIFHIRGERQKEKARLLEQQKQQMAPPPPPPPPPPPQQQVPEMKPPQICWRCGTQQDFTPPDPRLPLDSYGWYPPSDLMYYPPGTYNSNALASSEFRYPQLPLVRCGYRRYLQEPEAQEIRADRPRFGQELVPFPIANRLDRSMRPDVRFSPLYYGMPPPWTIYNPYDYRFLTDVDNERDRKK